MVFAERLSVSTQYISDLERGVVGASVQTIIKICDELNISADYILRGTEPLQYKSPQTLITKISSLSETQQAIIERGVDVLIDALQNNK